MIIDEELRCTKMAVIDLSRICNTKCKCCYYRWETFDCPDSAKRQVWSKTVQQVRAEIIAAVNRGCDRVDFTGGEPTIYPHMAEIIEYCIQRKLTPRIITNGQASEDKMYQLIGAGCKDWLLSIHDIEEHLTDIMQVPHAWENMLRTINIIKQMNCHFATNTVIMRDNYDRLPKIAAWIAASGAYLANFINCNPQYSGTAEQFKDIDAKVSLIEPFLKEAIDILDNRNIWINVRYFPHCMFKGYERHIVNHPVVMCDWRNEWDYGAYPKTVDNYIKFGREAFQYKSDMQE